MNCETDILHRILRSDRTRFTRFPTITHEKQCIDKRLQGKFVNIIFPIKICGIYLKITFSRYTKLFCGLLRQVVNCVKYFVRSNSLCSKYLIHVFFFIYPTECTTRLFQIKTYIKIYINPQATNVIYIWSTHS